MFKKINLESSNRILFYYPAEEIFNEVSLMSSFMTKNLSGDASVMDEFAISDDERNLFDVCVRQTLPNIYEAMLKITSPIDNAFDDAYEVKSGADGFKGTGTSATERAVGVYIQMCLADNDAYNSNVLSLIDASLLNCIKYGILREFYSTCLNTDLHAISNNKFIEELTLLKKRLFQLKKKKAISSLS